MGAPVNEQEHVRTGLTTSQAIARARDFARTRPDTELDAAMVVLLLDALDEQAIELERLRPIQQRARHVADSRHHLGDWPILARHILGEA